MWKSYFMVGWRNLVKNKLFSAINVAGMAISIASVAVIALFIRDELQYDKHVADYERKYRVYTVGQAEDGTTRHRSMIPPMIAPTAANDFPEIEQYARFLNFNYPVLFKVGNKRLTEKGGGYADASFLEMFSLKAVEGDMATALNDPQTIAINQTLKQKYFGSKPALGESIVVGTVNYKVTAVFQDFPSHSHLQLNYFLPMVEFASSASERMQRWTWSQFHTYIRLKPGADVAALEKKMEDMVIRHTPEERHRYLPRLMPIGQIHLHAYDHQWDIAKRGNIQTVYILFATAVFILLIAILNFVNLSTARAVNRAKEVGVRKVIGAYRVNLIGQFISESTVVALIAMILGGVLVSFLLPYLNDFTEKSISTTWFAEPLIVLSLVALTLFIGLAAGVYPAFHISRHRPAEVLAGKDSSHSGKNLLRKGLVIFQFMLSFFLIIASYVISDQYTFMRTARMGFDKDNVVVLQLYDEMTRNLKAAKEEFVNHPNIASGTMGYGLPGEAFAGDGVIDKVTNKEMGVSLLTVDHDYVKTLGMKIIAGRDFSEAILSDEKHAFIISEQAAKLLGYPDPKDALEHPIAWNRWDAQDSLKEGKVIGVVEDIQLNSMRETFNPVVLHVFPPAYNTLTLKINEDNVPATIAHLEEKWKKFNTEWPFEYRFLDENFDRMYKSEEKLATLFTWFTTFTIFVACLGMFGLVVYSTSQRYKEISIRKVFGAREAGLVVQLSKTYAALIFVAFVIAAPLSYFAAAEWLQKFAFRISITPLLFVKAAVLIAGISLLTIGIQTLKAARANPVKALREQ